MNFIFDGFLHLHSTIFPPAQAFIPLNRGAYSGDKLLFQKLPVHCEYGNEHNEHAVVVLRDGEIVGHLPRPISCFFPLYLQFHVIQARSFFGHTIHKSFVYLHQTVLQLPPLMSVWPPPRRCYAFLFVSIHAIADAIIAM